MKYYLKRLIKIIQNNYFNNKNKILNNVFPPFPIILNNNYKFTNQSTKKIQSATKVPQSF